MIVPKNYGQGEWIFNLLSKCGISEGVVFEAGAATPHHPFTNSTIFTQNNYKTLLCESDKESCLEWEKIDNKLITIINKSIKYERKGLENILFEMKSPY